jgi:3-hydroxyisobutyrate dehydrogenase-like beta-hydroxyacid dehydrogenase
MTASDTVKGNVVGIIGLGVMGSAFASNLLSRGHQVHVYNRTREKARPLAEKGATVQGTPRELASASDIILTSLTDQNAVDAVAYGEDGFLKGAKKGALWIDLSTIDPQASVKHSEAAREAGLERLDAPVVGSVDLAGKGELIVLVGGDNEVFRRNEGFLNEIGRVVIYEGPNGNGHRMKLAVNLFLGLVAESFSESLTLAEKLGLDPRAFVDLINRSPHANYYTKGKGPRVVEGNFEAAFSLDNLLKDLKLVNAEIGRSGAHLPLAKVALREYSEAAREGLGKKDFSAILLEVRRKNGL